MKQINMVGQIFGNLEVIARHHGPQTRKGTFWLCRCKCGKEKIKERSNLLNGLQTCGCSKNAIKSKSNKWSGHEEIDGTFWCNMKSNAKRRKISFDIDIKYIWNLYLAQERKCAITSLPIHFSPNRNSKGTASLDRITSSIGYAIGNIQWVHKDINIMKNKFSEQYFVEMCKLVANNKSEQC